MFSNITFLDVFEELRFIIELLLGELVLVLPCSQKRENFLKRIIPSSIIMLILSQGYVFLVKFLMHIGITQPFMSIVVIAWYCFLVLMSCLYLTFNFKFNFEQSLLYASAGYALQHIEYALINEFIALTLIPKICANVAIYFLICVSSYLIILVPTYFFISRKFKNIGNVYAPERRSTTILYTLMLILTLFLSFAGQDIYRRPGVENPDYLGLLIELSISALILFSVFLLLYENKRKNEKEIINQLLHENNKQFLLKKDSIDLINRKCHDLKHQIEDLKTMQVVDRNEVLNKLQKEIMIYDINIHTNNEVLDIILMEKELYCLNNNIKLSYLGDASKLKTIDTSDIYTLFGNAIDNAIEASEKLEIPQRIISVNIDNYMGNILINITNYFDGTLEKKDGTILTRKEKNGYHGYGLSSIKSIVKKYKGIISISSENNIFNLKIMIPTAYNE